MLEEDLAILGKDNDKKAQKRLFKLIEHAWYCGLSICLWFNLMTTPAIMIFPNLKTNLYYLLWLNEFFWILDIAHKLLMQKKPGKDPYDMAVSYIKSTFILDLIATFPQVASGMSIEFTVFKNVRLYKIELLHYPLALALRTFFISV